MTNFKKMCAASLAALLLVTGCVGGDKSWVYRSGDVQPAAGVYIQYLIGGVTNAITALSEAGVDVSAMTQKEVLEQTIEDQPAPQWIIADAEKELRENIAVEQQFAAEGVALPEGASESVESSVAQEWVGLGAVYEENGIAQSSMTQVMLNSVKRSALFTHYYGEGGKTPVADEELEAVLVKDYAKVGLLPIPKATADETGTDGAVTATIDEQNAALKTEAEGYVQRLNDGEVFEDVVFEYEKSAAGDGAADVVKPEPGSQSIIVSADMSGMYYSAELVDGAMAIPEGTTELVEDDSFYYVLQRTDILADPADFDSLRTTLLSNLKSEEFDAMVETWASELQVEVNQAALNQYTPERLKLDQ
jgi:hypothetical protein